jgi:large subunit ribosomal protein L10
MKATGFSRVSKDIIIGEIEKEIKGRTIFFVVEHGALPAAKLDGLRAKLRAANTRYFAVKNSLGRRAFNQANLQGISESLTGSCGVAFADKDPVLPSKILMDFAKDNATVKVKTAYMNGAIVGADQVKTLATLPSREVLLAKALGGMKAPVTNFVGVLAGTLRKMVTVIDAIAKKKGAQ